MPSPLPHAGLSASSLALLLLAASGVACAQAPDEKSRETARRMADFAQSARSVGFNGAVLAAKGGDVFVAIGVGWADLEGQVENTPATLFEIASATKQFTAAAVMRLVQEGRLGLDDPIAKHLPGVPENCKAITVRHLLQHTSGIPGTNSEGAGTDLARVLPSFLRGGPLHAPGTCWEYWNQGYALLSEIVARGAGKSYTDYCRGALFAPAGMTATRFTGDAAPADAIVAMGRSTRGEPRSALAHPYGSYGFQYRGMGGAVTNLWDLWRWDRALHGEKILGAAAKAQLFEPGPGDYALGWFVRKDAHGRLVQSHGGGVRGFVAEIRRYPKEDGCLFVLCNRDDAPVGQMAQGLEEILFGDAATVAKPPRPLDAGLLSALAGSYRDDRGTEMAIEADGAVARARIHWPNGAPDTHAALGLDDAGEVVFYEWTATTRVKVERRGQEAAERVTLGDQEFRRVP